MQKIIFFDIDGTLVDLAEPVEEVYARIAQSKGVTVNASALKPYIKSRWNDLHMQYVNAAGGFKTDERRERKFWETFVAAVFGDALVAEQDFSDLFEDIFRFYETTESRVIKTGAVEELKKLKSQGFLLAAHSNLDARILHYLNSSELGSLFDKAYCVSDVGFKKPSLQTFRQLEDLAKCTSKSSIYVGNTLDLDYQPAKAAGWQAFLLASATPDVPGVETVSWQNMVDKITQTQ